MATEITFEVQGLRELHQRLNNASDSVLRIALNEGLRKIGHLFVTSKGIGPLADETPKRTGKGARSTHFRIGGTSTNQRLEILQPAQTEEGDFYLHIVREGAKPHEIRPKKGKALKFEKDGEIIFISLVHHPGFPGNPYHQRVLARLRPSVQKIVNEIGQKVTAYLSGGR